MRCGSDGHDLLLLFFHGSINVLDILIGQLLDILFHGLLGVLGQLAGLLHGLGLIHGIAAHIAHSHLGILAQLGDFLCQKLTDKYIKNIDAAVEEKQKEIMAV